jgi:Tfp pilus assembly protein PilF
VQVCLGSIAAEAEELDEADERFSRALSFNPYSVPALASRGEVRLRQGRLAEGKVDLEAALAQDPQAKQETTVRARALLASMK